VNFLGMGPMELVLIMVLALIVFGPGKLPEIAGQMGKMVRDFRNATSDMSSEFNKAFSLETQEGASPPATTGQPSLPSAVDSSIPTTATTGPSESAEQPRIAPPSAVAAARSADLQPPY
jgi:TatA/E family protein of Tat protein translocase